MNCLLSCLLLLTVVGFGKQIVSTPADTLGVHTLSSVDTMPDSFDTDSVGICVCDS